MGNQDKQQAFIKVQYRSTKGWVDQFNRHRDMNSALNAAVSLGKFLSLYNLYVWLYGEEHVKEETRLKDMFDEFEKVYDEVLNFRQEH